jgi:hypothetical protein
MDIRMWVVVQVQLLKKPNGLFNYRISDLLYTSFDPVEPIPSHEEVVRDVDISVIRKICQKFWHMPYLVSIHTSPIKSRNGVVCVEYTYDFWR